MQTIKDISPCTSVFYRDFREYPQQKVSNQVIILLECLENFVKIEESENSVKSDNPEKIEELENFVKSTPQMESNLTENPQNSGKIEEPEKSENSGKPTAIVKPHSDSMEKPKKKPLPPKPWLKKKKKEASQPSSGSYNLDFLDKLDILDNNNRYFGLIGQF